MQRSKLFLAPSLIAGQFFKNFLVDFKNDIFVFGNEDDDSSLGSTDNLSYVIFF